MTVKSLRSPHVSKRRERPARKFLAVELTTVEIDLLRQCEKKHNHRNRSEFVRAAIRSYAKGLLRWPDE
jgi:hypothetical protein